MKGIIYLAGILSMLNIGMCFSKDTSIYGQLNQKTDDTTKKVVDTSDDDKFKNWTEEQYKHYEDSILAKLYPPVIAQKADSSTFGNTSDVMARVSLNLIENTHVPNTVYPDRQKEAGQITINSGTSPTGAKTYNVPINVYPGMKGFNPNLSLAYNSQQGNSVMGMGWAISGISMITRSGKNMYYDGKPQGVVMDNSDAFILDGIRLIKTQTSGDCFLYESEQGNIKAKGHVSGNIMRYFEVFYPDGNKGVFGHASSYQNYLCYPLMSLTDLDGNRIDYSYSFANNHFYISNISYNGASVEFQYEASRQDPILYFVGGLKVYEPQLLKSVTCKLGSAELGTYTMQYTTQNGKSLLTQIGYESSGKSYNPLRFYYGNGTILSAYKKDSTQLYEWYVADDPGMIKVAKGKFNYDSGADGLIALPNLNPYWKHYIHSTTFRKSEKRFDNMYTGEEKIFLYAGLTNGWAYPMPSLYTEKGFVDILCADLEGKQEEYIVKVNNSVVNDNDQVVFNVYRFNLFPNFSKHYTRTYNFPTVFTDAKDEKSVQPKFYYTGDFNGDGKMEILAVSVHQPFEDTSKPSKCYIFDLEGNRILFQGHVFPYNVDFLGTLQSDPKAAADNTDKLFVMDYDGDGKSDICHINESGTNIYTFDVSGGTLTARKVVTFTGLNKSGVAGRDVLPGEYNGDGMMDILVSPADYAYTWTMYNSKGNGQFESSTFNGTAKTASDDRGFVIQDVNGDGATDLINYNADGFYTYLANNNNVGSVCAHTSYPSSKSILIPTNINSRNSFTQLISLKNGVATRYSFSRNDSKEAMATGMANSLGVIEKNEYQLINDEGVSDGLYTKGYNATYPYVNIQEPLPVIASSEIYMDGSQIDYTTFKYHNAVVHRQGLGLCGFEKITTQNKREQDLVRTYEPYRRGLLKSEVTPAYEYSYSYTVNTQANKITKIRLISKVETDLLKGISASTSYLYDTYGYPTEEATSYTGNITVKKTNTYSSNTAVEDGYNLGFLVNQVVTVTRDGDSYTERMSIPAFSLRKPNVKIYYKDGNQVRQHTYIYDTHGNPVSETLKLFSSPNTQKTTYEYDSYGRLSKVTSPMGLANTFAYDALGRVSTVQDYKGGVTTHEYDALGREISTCYPDSTREDIAYTWSYSGTNARYAITRTKTGKPTTSVVYDAFNREVRTSETGADELTRSIDKLYDAYGNIQKVSLPFTGATPSLWNTYAYDDFDRILSCYEASGRVTTYSYNGNSVTTVADNVTTTKSYDAMGDIISVTDASGTTTYNLAADRQPSSVVAPGNVVTSFGYDNYRRRITMVDPSQGTTTSEYDAAGNLKKETNANGESALYAYDEYNRLTKTTTPEFETSYTYNEKDELTGIVCNNGTSKAYGYDSFGRLVTSRENGVDGTWLQKDFCYQDGNVSSITYTSQNGHLATENYTYRSGHLKTISLGDTKIYDLYKVNNLGQATEINTDCIKRTYGYTDYGLPTSRSASFLYRNRQDFSYVFDPATSLLTSRTDNIRGITENFGYDNLNRLTSYSGKTVTYDEKGNITSKSDVGSFYYDIAQKPYAVSGVTLSDDALPTHTQDIDYFSFMRPQSMSENGNVATFTYNSEYERVKMSVLQDGDSVLTRYYLGGCYEMDETSSSTKEKLYLGGGYYDSGAVLIKDGSSSTIYYIVRDYLGSITHIMSPDGTVAQELSYDAWGRLRDPETHEVYGSDQQPVLFLGRGYTGHEHLAQFGLINMNARLYDPVLGRFLSPDPNVQEPYMPQNFNRFSYAMNNPLCYVDENGKFWWLIIGAAIGGVVNLVNKAVSGQLHSFGDGLAAFGIGAVAGGVGCAAGAWAFAAVGGAVGGAGGFLAGSASGAIGTAASIPLQSAGNSMYFNDPFLSFGAYFTSIIFCSFTGGMINGTIAAFNNRNFWTGDNVLNGKTFSFRNDHFSSNTGNSSTETNFLDNSPTRNTNSTSNADIHNTQKTIQEHHFATNKNKTYTPEFEKIAEKYDLNLNENWNKGKLPHVGRHPNEYHNWVLEQMKSINNMPNMNQQEFIKQFDIRVIQPVKDNPGMLNKSFWKQ